MNTEKARPFVLRLCSMVDVPQVEALIPLSVRSLQAGDYSEAQMTAALGTVFGVDTQLIRDGTFYVAESEGRIVGCGGWSRRKALFGSDQGKKEEDVELNPESDPARIRAFFVHPDWARHGIGTEIMKLSEEAAVSAGFKRIDIIATLTGERLYARFGYDVVERYEVGLSNGCSLPVVRMTKLVHPPVSQPAK